MDHRPVIGFRSGLSEETPNVRPKNVYSIDQILGNSISTVRDRCNVKEGKSTWTPENVFSIFPITIYLF